MEYLAGAVISGGQSRMARVGIDGDRIASVAAGTTGAGYIIPGFVDQHCHGGGGFDVATDARAAAQFHLARGTTTMVASLVTADRRTLGKQIESLIGESAVAGVHLEGPWLSPDQCGAHDVNQLRSPDPAEIADLLGSGIVRMVTFAPELPGALDAITQVVEAGVAAAIGHTDCDYDTAVAAIDAGASVATHLFNRMPHLGKRAPGPVLALLEDPRVTLELIADGVHLDPHLLRYVIAAAGPDRVATVTDAMAAAGAGDGGYRIGDLAVTVRDGVARLADNGALAGSTLTCDAALRNLVAAGVPLPDAVTTLTSTPAVAMGLTDRGVVEPGFRADLVMLDEDLSVTRVMRAGHWIL